jgi:hypothetical protein
MKIAADGTWWWDAVRPPSGVWHLPGDFQDTWCGKGTYGWETSYDRWATADLMRTSPAILRMCRVCHKKFVTS